MRNCNYLKITRIIILIFLMIHNKNILAQKGVVFDDASAAKMDNEHTLKELLWTRFKDSISGIDSMVFYVVISKRGKLTKVEYVNNFYAPRVTHMEKNKIIQFMKDEIKWIPGYTVKNRRKIFVESNFVIFVDPDRINQIENLSRFPIN